jgi:Tfp pilus assembly protein PilN
MRPINLIPKDERRGAGGKDGPLAYVLIGALVILLAGVAVLVSTDNQISTSKAEVVELRAENSAAKAQVAKLAGYTKLEEGTDGRTATVSALADSRFDWERVMRELALILPRDIWLSNLSGSVDPSVSVNGGTASSLRGGAAGPALEIVGCGRSQDSVAGFVSALRDIDGVTRVAMQYSKLPEGASESDSSTAGGGCQTRPWIPEFQIVASFDAAPTPAPEATTGE